MIRSQETVKQNPAENLLLEAGDPLVSMAHMRRIRMGKEALLDMDQPAFVRRILKLGLPHVELGSRRASVPAPISKLLNIVLGQDGILFPIEET